MEMEMEIRIEFISQSQIFYICNLLEAKINLACASTKNIIFIYINSIKQYFSTS